MRQIIIKNRATLDKMRSGGRLLAEVMETLSDMLRPGISTLEIDFYIEKKMRSAGLVPVCKGYAGYKHATCISLNNVVVHGVPAKEIVLKSGDFVKIDVVGSYKNYCVDMARYYFIGDVKPVVKRLAAVAQDALDKAISKIRPGVFLSDISSAVQTVAEAEGFGVVRDFAGHGIGKSIHEQPDIPNYGRPGHGPILREGMTLAIEPMITERGYEVLIMEDGWTAVTKDGGYAAHVEDTVVVTANGVEILTRLPHC